MLGIKVDNENLELLPGASLQMEMNNPYTQFTDEILGEYSLPIELPLSPKNNRLLKLAGMVQKKVDDKGIDVSAYDGNFQHSIGKLKHERNNANLNRMQNGRVSMYYLTGISYFYQDIKDKNLRDADYGGVRKFNWDAYNINGNGFWGHIHKVLNAPAGYGTSGYDYAFPVVINRLFNWKYYNDSTKALEDAGTLLINQTFKAVSEPLQFAGRGYFLNDGQVIVPYCYLKFVLEKLFAYVGWKVQGAILNDPSFCKIIVDNARAIDWCIYEPNRSRRNSKIRGRQTIEFNLADHLPDVSIGNFLLALRNHFGWWYDVDRKTKTVTIEALKDVAATGAKDMTAKANPVLPKKVVPKKVYALKSSNGAVLDLSGFKDMGEVENTTNLPAATDSKDQQVYLVRTENMYYLCKIRDDDPNSWAWHPLQCNNVNVVPAGANDEITTQVSVPEEKFFRSSDLDLAPEIPSSGYWPGRTEDGQTNNITLMFYWGLKTTKTGYPYAFASHHIYDSNGNQLGDWSLAFLGKKKDGTNVGLYHLAWKPFLDKLQTTEEIEVKLYLSKEEMRQLRFHDEINVKGLRMYISKMKVKVPYTGEVELTCSRI